MSAFYAVITDDRSGEELARYELADADLLDCDVYAERYADESGFALDKSEGYVFNGCADFTVTLREPGRPAVVCWSSQSYFIAHEDD